MGTRYGARASQSRSGRPPEHSGAGPARRQRPRRRHRGRGLPAARQPGPYGPQPQQRQQGRERRERQGGAEREQDPAQQGDEHVPAARQGVRDAGGAVTGRRVHRCPGQRQRDGGEARAVLQGRLPGRQRLQAGLTVAQLALQRDDIAELGRPGRQCADPVHARPLRLHAAGHVHDLVGDVLGLLRAADQPAGALEFGEDRVVRGGGHPQDDPGVLAPGAVPARALVADVAAGVLRGGPCPAQGLGDVLDLEGEGGGPDDRALKQPGRPGRRRAGARPRARPGRLVLPGGHAGPVRGGSGRGLRPAAAARVGRAAASGEGQAGGEQDSRQGPRGTCGSCGT